MSDPTSYKALDALLTRNDKRIPSRKIANHTYAQRRAVGPYGRETIAIRYHETDVVTYDSVGCIALNTGGWLTLSTKERINRFTPRCVQVHSQSGRWYVTTMPRGEGTINTSPDYGYGVVPFADGIVLEPYQSQLGFHVRNHLTGTEVDQQNRHNRAIEKLLDKYLRGLDENTHRIIVGNYGRYRRRVPGEHDEDGEQLYVTVQPHEGCPMCVSPEIGVLVGDKFEDVQHLIEHMQDGVYPFTLLCTASLQVGTAARAQIYDLNRRDLRAYLRQQLYVGPVALAHGKRPRHTRHWRLEQSA